MHLVITVFLFLFSISIFAKIPFDSTKNDRFSIHAQATVINQFKPKFKANYSGENSLSAAKENKISIFSPIATALIGYKVQDEVEWLVPAGLTKIRIDEIIYQPEAAGDFNL